MIRAATPEDLRACAHLFVKVFSEWPYEESWSVDQAHHYTHELILRTMAALAPPAPAVLDLGAGTGRLSKLVLGRFPRSRVTLLDVSERLLTEAARQLEETGAAFRTVVGVKNSLIEDSPLDVPHHLSLLSRVGFERVDVLWKKGLFAGYGGFGKRLGAGEESR